MYYKANIIFKKEYGEEHTFVSIVILLFLHLLKIIIIIIFVFNFKKDLQ